LLVKRGKILENLNTSSVLFAVLLLPSLIMGKIFKIGTDYALFLAYFWKNLSYPHHMYWHSLSLLYKRRMPSLFI